MKKDSTQQNGDQLNKLTRTPRGLENKFVPKYELDPYFSVISLEDLIFTLYQFKINGFFQYEIMLSSEYLDWEKARTNALLDTSNLKPIDPFGSLRQHKYQLSILGSTIKTDTPLSGIEVSAVLRVLPSDMAERFLRFKLSSIDQKRMREIIALRPIRAGSKIKIDNHYTVGYKGLIVSGADVTYKGKTISLSRQKRELLRVFLTHPEVTILPDEFIDNVEIFNPEKTYEHEHQTLSQLISATRIILKQSVGKCIYNNPSVGWYIKFD